MKQTTEKITVSLPADTLRMADEKYKVGGADIILDLLYNQEVCYVFL